MAIEPRRARAVRDPAFVPVLAADEVDARPALDVPRRDEHTLAEHAQTVTRRRAGTVGFTSDSLAGEAPTPRGLLTGSGDPLLASSSNRALSDNDTRHIPTRAPGDRAYRPGPRMDSVRAMFPSSDKATLRSFAERYCAARAHLRAQMSASGMLAAEGWGITEITREEAGRTVIVLRPVHLHQPTPEGFECIVWVERNGETVDAHCEPGGRPT